MLPIAATETIWSQEFWEHKILNLKNGGLFYRSMVEVEFPEVL